MDTIVQLLDATIRLSVPLLLACLAGLYSERSGIFDIGLEGKMLAGAFAAGAAAAVSGSAWMGLGVAILVSFWVSSEYRSVEKWRTVLVGSLGPWPRTERFEIREAGLAVVTPFAHFFRPWSMLSSVQEHAGGMTLHWQLGDPTDLPSRCLTSEVKQALARAANLDLT